MKRILSLFTLLILSVATFAQHTTPRPPYSNGSATRIDITRLVQNLTDAAGKDTVYISPNAHQNFYSINAGDTIKGSLTIGLQNVTKNGVAYSKANVYKYDEVVFDYRTSGLLVDTLFFYGAFVCDSSGSGSATTVIIPKVLTKENYLLKFTWDGAKFVQNTLYK